MKKIIVIGSVVAVFLMLVTPSVPAVQFNLVKETFEPSESKIYLFITIKTVVDDIKVNISKTIKILEGNQDHQVGYVPSFIHIIQNSLIGSLKKVDTILSITPIVRLGLNQTPILNIIMAIISFFGAIFSFLAVLISPADPEAAIGLSLLAALCVAIVLGLELFKRLFLQGLTEPKANITI